VCSHLLFMYYTEYQEDDRWDHMESRLKWIMCLGVVLTMPKGAFDHISTWRKNTLVALRCEAVIVSADHCLFGVNLMKFKLHQRTFVFWAIENQTKSKRNCMDNGGEGKGKEGKGQDTSEGLQTRKTRRRKAQTKHFKSERITVVDEYCKC